MRPPPIHRPIRFLPAQEPQRPERIPTITLKPRNEPILSLWRGDMSSPGRWTMPEMLELVAEAYSVGVLDLKGPDRHQWIVHPRQHAMWLMSQQSHLSLSMIGRFLGGRDHTTVLHGLRAHAARVAAQAEREAA